MRKEIIGNATLYQGDCLEVLSNFGTKEVDAVVTDPPYGIGNNSSWNGFHGECLIQNDQSIEMRDAVLEMLDFKRGLIFGSPKILKPKNTRQTIIWEKGGHTGMGDLSIPWKPNYEEIYVIGSGFVGKRTSGVIHIISDRECNGIVRQRYHPTEKPLFLMTALIGKTPGKIIDPFMGSGTTGIACIELGREFTGIEIEPKYFDIACKRIEQAQRQLRLFEAV